MRSCCFGFVFGLIGMFGFVDALLAFRGLCFSGSFDGQFHQLAYKEMSPASRSKGKDKSSARVAKDQQKTPSKAPASGATGNGVAASAYDPLSGTFHTLETPPPAASSPPSHSNGRFRNIDETEEHSGSSLGAGAEYDSVSNNDSCSGESEDQKEKTSGTAARHEAIPGADNDKREKIRQKNERKHQRQRERRAQELHEKCNGYLMSRKLEALAQQLVAMGFSSERATVALILNEGRIEESVAWLFEGGEEGSQPKDTNVDSNSNLKIDITEELARIADMELRFRLSKQEVERAVVAVEGDLDKAAETLRAQKQEPPTSPPKPEEIGDPPATSVSNTCGAAAAAAPDPANRNLQSLKRIQPKPEWARPQATAAVEKRWTGAASSPSVSYSLASPLQAASPPVKTEVRYVAVGGEVKNLLPGTLREPVIMMQRPQTISAKQNPPETSASVSFPATWYPSSVTGAEIMKPNASPNASLPQISSSTNIGPNSINAQQFYQQPHYQSLVSTQMESPASGWGGSWSTTASGMSSSSSSTSLAVPSSLGLFSGWGSNGGSGSSSSIDWNTGGSIPHCDYTSIDWTLESTSSNSRPGGLWMGLASFVKNNRMYDDSWSSLTASSAAPTSSTARSTSSNSVRLGGLQEGGVAADAPPAPTSDGLQEWTSPFEGKDLFNISRQFVATSPSL
ncbi:hypothetical protein Syun_002697 [Stephania yunnanensis]|uniref:UBA domain-containing protein n=1 Tax=Stephania yunnanensis TaxID=152371 RepID=A0AAP0Q7E1_9MAGN